MKVLHEQTICAYFFVHEFKIDSNFVSSQYLIICSLNDIAEFHWLRIYNFATYTILFRPLSVWLLFF